MAIERIQSERASRWLWRSWTALILFCPWFLLEAIQLSATRRSDLVLALPFVMVVGTFGLWRFTGVPTALVDRILFVLTLVLIVVTPVVVCMGLYHRAVVLVLMGLLRFCIMALWIAGLLAILLLAETMRRRKLRWRTWVPMRLRQGLTVLMLLCALEGTSRLIEHSKQRPLRFPNDLPLSSPDTFHVAAVGGSTMKGFPYNDRYGIANVAVWLIQQMYPQHTISLNNVAESGIDLRQALANLGKLKSRPDVIVVYSGHNEFFHGLEQLAYSRRSEWPRIDPLLSYSALFRVLRERFYFYASTGGGPESSPKLCEEQLCPTEIRIQRLADFEKALVEFHEWAKRNQIAIVYCVPVADEADFEPNKSFAEGITAKQEARVTDQWKQLRQLQRAGQHEQALSICMEILAEFPDIAEFHFRAGECFRSLQRADEAAGHFYAAIDEDQAPIRATSAYRKAGLAVAQRYGDAIVDSDSLLRRYTDDHLLDRQLFLDGVHPNLKATFVLGTAVADEVRRGNLLAKFGSPAEPTRTSFAASTADLNVDVDWLVLVYRRTADVLWRYASLRSVEQGRRIADAKRFEQLADDLNQHRISPGENGSESLSADVIPAGSSANR